MNSDRAKGGDRVRVEEGEKPTNKQISREKLKQYEVFPELDW